MAVPSHPAAVHPNKQSMRQEAGFPRNAGKHDRKQGGIIFLWLLQAARLKMNEKAIKREKREKERGLTYKCLILPSVELVLLHPSFSFPPSCNCLNEKEDGRKTWTNWNVVRISIHQGKQNRFTLHTLVIAYELHVKVSFKYLPLVEHNKRHCDHPNFNQEARIFQKKIITQDSLRSSRLRTRAHKKDDLKLLANNSVS